MRWLAVLWAVVGVASAGVDRFVDPVNGDDVSAGCSAALPCKTITRAFLAAQSGDRVIAAPGTYGRVNGEFLPLTIPVGVRLSGSGGAAVTFLVDDDTGAAGETVRSSFDAAVLATGIEGFTIDGLGLAANRYGVWFESFTTNDPVAGDEPFVRDCRLTGFARAAIAVATWGFGAPGGETKMRAVIERNDIRASGSGIYVLTIPEDGVTRAHDASMIRNNLVVGCGVGIEVAAAVMTAATGTGRLDTMIRHNTLIGATSDAVVLTAPDARVATDGVAAELANNILVWSAGYGVREEAAHDFADSGVLVANAFHGNGLGGYRDSGGAVYTSAFELNMLPDGVVTHGNRDDDPRVDSTNGGLALDSPCRDAGDALYSASDDIAGQRRPVAFASDIGADEILPMLRGEFSSVTPLQPPAATVYPALPEWLNAPRTPLIDVSATAPLTVYRLGEGGPAVVLFAIRTGASVRLEY